MFDTLSVFESYPIDTSGMGGNTDIAGMRVTAVNARDATHYPLTVLSVAEPTLQVSLRYQPAAFDRAAVDTTCTANVADSCRLRSERGYTGR